MGIFSLSKKMTGSYLITGGEGRDFDERPEDQRVMKYEERRKSNSLEMFQ